MTTPPPRRPWWKKKRAWAAVALWLALPAAYVGAYIAISRPGLWPISGGRIKVREATYPHPALKTFFKPAERLDPRLRSAPWEP